MNGGTREADRARLKDVEAEISEFGESLNRLRREKQRIQTRLDDYKYPVLTLPNEIVSEIFIHFLPTYPVCPSPTGLFSPTHLTQICRKWRQIAVATPTLWRAISLNPDLQPAFDSRKQILETWLVRSCSCPVSVKICDDSDSVGQDIFQALLPHRLRWEYLELNITGEQLPILDGPAPLLRDVNLHFDRSPSSPVSFKETPLLRTVTLNYEVADNIVLPWAHLTSLTLTAVYPEECTPILLQTGRLVDCKLALVGSSHHGTEPDVDLPCLESLSLIWEDNTATIGYLCTFKVPALRTLEVPELFLDSDPIFTLTAFTSNSGCKLQEVYITGPRSTPSALYREALPSVSNFSFEFESGEDDDP
ncbi:hypothetical protein C8R43DRAFT_414649 [Mycena crocata]|nr:hypothetical protein C8R43DRAFT_414649 [Mycena crocata]